MTASIIAQRAFILAAAAKLELDATLLRYGEALEREAWDQAEEYRIAIISLMEAWCDLLKTAHMAVSNGPKR